MVAGKEAIEGSQGSVVRSGVFVLSMEYCNF